MSRQTYEGVLTVQRYTVRTSYGRLARRQPPPVGWVVLPAPSPGGRGYMMRFKRLPLALHHCHGHRVRVVCTPAPWSNGLGAYATRPVVECLDLDEHVLAALAKLPAPGRRR